MSFSKSLKSLPKAHLHIHLEGAMRPTTLTELCKKYALPHPIDTRGQQFPNFSGFNALYRSACESIRSKDDLAQVIFEVVEDAALEGVIWIEPAFDADRYSTMRDKDTYRLFASARECWEFVLSEAENASKKTGVGIGFISAIDRTQPLSHGIKRAELTAQIVKSGMHLIQSGMKCFGHKHPGIIGLGLHGNEEGFPPELFEEAFNIGLVGTSLLSIPHAGEIAPFPNKGAESVANAIDILKANRIQHGVLAIDDKSLVRRLAETNICLDICPSSNIQLSVFPTIQSHPLPKLIKAGVACSIGSDDPLLFGPSLLDEYQVCRSQMKFNDKTIAQLAHNSFEYSGAPAEVKDFGFAEIEKWLGL
jgi:adenosine deaminase